MIIPVQYQGYSSRPSDYKSADGDLALSLNLINETGETTPIPQPVEQLPSIPGLTVYSIHSIPSSLQFYIFYKESDNSFSYAGVDGFKLSSVRSLAIFDNNVTVYSVTPLGNTLIFSTSVGIRYFVYKDGAYVDLGERPPFVPIEFALNFEAKVGNNDIKLAISEDEYRQIIDMLPDGGRHYARPQSDRDVRESFMTALTDAIYGNLYSGYKDCCMEREQQLYYQPFFVRYAFRLYDGSYLWHSSPVLMLPTTTTPIMNARKDSVYDSGIYTNYASADVRLYSLYYRILDFADISLWKDIISGIDIFISAPIYTYDQAGKIGGYEYLGRKYSHIVEGAGTTDPSGERPGSGSGDLAVADVYRLDRITNVDYYGRDTDTVNVTPPSWKPAACNADRLVWAIPEREDRMLDDIKSCHTFYRAASIEFDDIISFIDMREITYEHGFSVDNITTRPTLPDEYQSHHTYIPRLTNSYNSRISIADIGIRLGANLPIRSMMTWCAPSKYTEAKFIAKTRITFRKDMETYISEYETPVNSRTKDPKTSPYIVDSILSQHPVYLYIPDPDAVSIEFLVQNPDGSSPGIISFPLRRHDFLNGAYYFSGFTFDIDRLDYPCVTGSSFNGNYPDTVYRPNRLYLSDVNNPFVFASENMTSVGDSRIQAISTAAKALSQGQFGQFPLYAFTTEGVWAVEISSAGSYSARQPITRDVCINTGGITQIDSAVLFPTDRGIMLLSGSETTCISTAIDNNTSPARIASLPHIETLLDMLQLNGANRSIIPDIPLKHFLRDCGMVYDYAHQRIIIFNPDYMFGYVYSLRTQLWGMMYTGIRYAIRSYPQALAVSADGSLVDFSADGGTTPPQLLITRPVSLGDPDLHKTVDTVIQRGGFAKGKVQSVLYGSRDLFNWYIIRSSRNHRLENFSGSPYKYFRIALLCHLDPGETLQGATLQFRTRLTNRLR